ncbi:MAG: hypothetical protein K0S56_1557 [Microvirga sp.]|jgi:hypothetical protein|nr:hypothetical protein [Microvirga sp.]
MTINMPTETFTPAIGPISRATNDELRDICERQVAAKLCSMLPADEASAQRILARASALFSQFMSLEAVRADSAEG